MSKFKTISKLQIKTGYNFHCRFSYIKKTFSGIKIAYNLGQHTQKNPTNIDNLNPT